jgi:tetratricopeptide (TPR) repeat protein
MSHDYHDLIDKGYACLRRGDAQAALSRFRHAAQDIPERPQAYFAQAIAYLELGLSAETRQALEEALNADPGYATARAYLGVELLKQYDIDGAQRALDQALQDEPTNLLAHIKYAEYYYRLGFYHHAVELLGLGLHQPHGANEHIVGMAKELLTQARQKSKTAILRQPPDPFSFPRTIARFFRLQKKPVPVGSQVELN